MKKSILSFILLTVMAFGFSANIVPVEKAQLVSKNFVTELTGRNEFSTSDFVLVYTEVDENGDPVFYCFQFRTQGFIMISATESAQPILSFSFENNFDPNGSKNYFMLKYRDEISKIRKNSSLSKGYSSEWAHYSAENFIPNASKDGAGVEPLTTTTWSQEKYYNAYCPFDSRPSTTVTPQARDYRALNGCVAVNLTNLLFFHRWPVTGNSGVSYIPVDNDVTPPYSYPRQTVNFGQTNYNYNVMYEGKLGDINDYVNELAKTFYHTGVSVYMSYGNNGSGSNSINALSALKMNWKMNQFAANIRKEDMTSDVFVDSIISQLNRNLPVYMGATIDGEDGHAFMIDGYTVSGTNKYLHVNFGWEGFKNGYYAFGNLDGYNLDENILINVFPNVGDSILKPVMSIDTITATIGTISDGSGYIKYQNNSNRQWYFSTPGATSYKFDFSKIKTEATNDVITIYNGPTTASGIKAQFSGNYLMKGTNDAQGVYPSNFTGTALPASITVNASAVLVTFTSNATVNDYGFVLNYDATLASNTQTYGSGVISISGGNTNGIITEKNGAVADDVPYAANRELYFNGKGFYWCDGFAMAFTKFDLAEGDYVDIWTYENPNPGTLPELVKRFDMNNKPNGVINLNKGYFYVSFVSDNWKQGTGFKLEYWAIVGVNDIAGVENINVYPNPTSGQLNVAITSSLNENVTFQIVDMMGRTISSESIPVDGNYTYNTSVRDLSAGIYMVNVITSKGKSIHKFVVE